MRNHLDVEMAADLDHHVQMTGSDNGAPKGELAGAVSAPCDENVGQGSGTQASLHASVVGPATAEPTGGPWAPAFPRQRPPFEPGHELSVQHGAYSPRKVNPLAEELVRRVLGDESVAFLGAAAYRPALWAWARAEARCQLLEEFLGNAVGDLESVRVQSAYRFLAQTEARAATLRSQLGLTPMARARLGKDVAQGAAADAAAALTRAREEAERRAQEPRRDAGGGGMDG